MVTGHPPSLKLPPSPKATARQAGRTSCHLLLAPCYFTSGAEADDAGFAAGGGDFEIDDTESTAFLAAVRAAIAGADHDGVFVAGFSAEKHVDV